MQRLTQMNKLQVAMTHQQLHHSVKFVSDLKQTY